LSAKIRWAQRRLATIEARLAARRTDGGEGLWQPVPSRPVSVWRTCRAPRWPSSSVSTDSTPRSAGPSSRSYDGAVRPGPA